MIAPEQQVFTKAEAAEFLRCSPKTVQKLVHSGQLKAKRTSRHPTTGVASGHLRITRDALEAYIDGLPDA